MTNHESCAEQSENSTTLDELVECTTTSLYLSPDRYVIPSYHPVTPAREHGNASTTSTSESRTTSAYSATSSENRKDNRKKVGYVTNQEAAKDGPWKPNAPMVFIAPLIDTTVLQPHQMGSLNIRGYCTPGYNDDKTARIRSNDPDPQRVYWHEYFHFARIHGGDGSEEYVHMLEHWRLGDE
ncbi:hypothetical protein HYS47_03170 [Candidatus Woesearchaeota archaeon]|nr:hypothetical protein [Candidatus Woesearchaeota archaeon]